jgi:hypothetical protein
MGFNPHGIKRKINSIGQAGQAKRPFMNGHYLEPESWGTLLTRDASK